MAIEDKELRALFKAESDEHLQHLNEGLLKLEGSPDDSDTITELFREAHSLKGAARMLNVGAVEEIAHGFEDLLGSAKRGDAPLTASAIDEMYRSLDTLRDLVDEAVGAERAPTASPETADVAAAPIAALGGNGRIGTIRVEPHKLDNLMTHAGELVVARTRIARRKAQIDETVVMWEEWSRSRTRELSDRLGALLSALQEGIREDSTRLDFVADRLDEGVRAVRLLPAATVFGAFQRMVRDLARVQNKEVQLVVQGGETEVDKRVLEEIKDPLMHMIRNAVDHGIEAPSDRERAGKPRLGTIRLSAKRHGGGILIELGDDGRGLDADRIRAVACERGIATAEEISRMTVEDIRLLIFRPGFSTSANVTDVSGRGVGMDVVQTNIERLKGTIAVESTPGSGSTFRVRLPAALSVSRVLLVAAGAAVYALPMEHVHCTALAAPGDVLPVEGRDAILVDRRPVSFVRLEDILNLPVQAVPGKPRASQRRPCVILSFGDNLLGVEVDELLDEQDVILKSSGGILRRVRNVAGFAILASGDVCTVLNPRDMIRSVGSGVIRRTECAASAEPSRQSVLLVEDSITTRAWERRGLEAAGYEVTCASDGAEALKELSRRSFDAVVSDVEMPNMDGFTLTEWIRRREDHRDTPVILVTSLADDSDRKKGIEAGANAYIAKAGFDQKLLVDTLRRFL